VGDKRRQDGQRSFSQNKKGKGKGGMTAPVEEAASESDDLSQDDQGGQQV